MGKNVKMKISVTCRICKEVHRIEIDSYKDYLRWKQGELIQNVMPYLSVNDRELLISRTCDTCFHNMFGAENV